MEQTMKTPVTQESLCEAGFKPFKQKGLSQFTDSYWQKRFDDAKGKKYFISIAEYDNSQYPELYKSRGRYSFQPEIQFEANGVTFDVQMHSPKSIEEMQAFFENMWYSLGCDYYEIFD